MRRFSIKLFKILIGWPLSCIALLFLWKLFTPHLPTVLMHLKQANMLLLFLSLVAFQLYFLFRIILWHTILKDKKHVLPFAPTAWYWSIAEINRYIPGNIWSIVGRGVTFGKFGITQKTLFSAWLQESMLLVLGSSFVGLAAVGYAFSHLLPTFFLKAELYWATLLGIVVASGIWILQKKFLPTLLTYANAYTQFIFAGIAFIFFGLGTYLSIAALFPLPPEQLTTLVAFFSLSFTVGYLSFITPMGLGVREFVLSEGLLPFLLHTVVGFVSIFSRVWLVISEIVFLLLALGIHKAKVTLHTRFTTHVQQHAYIYALCLGILSYISYFTTASFLRYTNFFTGRFDLGNMDQTVWNSLHGKIFMLTDPNGTNVMSRLGTHADFILVLLTPFYVIWEDPRMLLFIQTVSLAFGALFLFLLAKNYIKSKSFALIVSFAYLLNPSVQYTNLYDFHAVTLATTLFLGAWYFLTKKRYLWMGIFLLLAGLTKEEAWIVVGFFGVYIFLVEKKKLLGSILAAGSFGAFYLLVWKLIPYARGGQHFALSYYADYGTTPTSIVKNIFLSPMKLFATIFSKGRLLYLGELLLPFGFLSIFSPLFLLFALPDAAINILSTNSQLQQITYQYTAVITPFLFVSSIVGVVRLKTIFPKLPIGFFSSLLFGSTLLSAYFFGPFIGALHPNIDMFVHQENDRSIIEGFLADIPSNLSVAATNNIGSHLSHRQNIYTIPVGIDKADIVVFLLNDAFAQPSLTAQKQIAENLKHDKNYIEVFRENDFVVFEKRNLYTRKEPTIAKGKLYPASIETLQNRDFEGGKIQVQKLLQNVAARSMLFSYPSDGLTLFAKADLPQGNGPFPVVIINRGYIVSSAFKEATSYENIAEDFVQHGFIAITPNFRNNGQSDIDRSIAGILGYPIDELNLINSLHTFPQADTKHVFLWGFSVGGQVTLTTLAAVSQNKNISPTIQAAAVWNTILDPYIAYAQFSHIFPGQAVPYQRVYNAFGPYATDPLPWQSISPQYYIQDINTPIRISDAFSDAITPYQWSIELYDTLKYYHKNAALSLYDTDHNFTTSWRQVISEDIAYFESFLK